MNKEQNLLIVEDEIISSEYLLSILDSFGFKNIFTASSMEEALDIVQKTKINLVFMDINISCSTDGITCAKILNKMYSIPIIYTTAYGDSQSILEASETNIYGYLIKPFEINHVEASLIVALKRIESIKKNSVITENQNKNIIKLPRGQRYSLLTQTFFVNNIPINLTGKEIEVLHILCKNLNQNISYNTLREDVWGYKDIANSTIRDTVSRLKRKTPNLNIQTVINYGYILKDSSKSK